MSTATTRVGAGVSGLLAYLAPIVALLAVWEAIATLGLVPPQSLPHTYVVAEAGWRLLESGVLVEAAAVTVARALAAFLLAIALGVAVGLGMARSRPLEWFFDPIVSVGFPVPKVTLVPVYVLWFGFGTLPTVLLAVTSATFPVAIATHRGAKGVDRELVWSARSMGLSRTAATREVVLPAALPAVFNGVQIAMFLSFVVVVVAEMVTSAGGLGELLTKSVRFFETPNALAAVLAVAVLGLAFDRGLRALRNHLLDWTDSG